MPGIALRLKASILPSQARVIWGVISVYRTGVGKSRESLRESNCNRNLESLAVESLRLEAQEMADAFEERLAYFGWRRRGGMRFAVPIELLAPRCRDGRHVLEH